MPTQYTGISRMLPAQDLFSHAANGALRAVLMHMQQEQAARQQQAGFAQERSMAELSNQNILAREEAARKARAGEIEAGHTFDIEQADKEFQRRLLEESLKNVAYSGDKLTPDLIEGLRGLAPDMAPETFNAVIKAVEGARAKTKAGAGGEKSKPADPTTVKADLAAALGFEPAAEVIRAVVGNMDKTGLPALYALGNLYPDPTKIPKAGEKPQDDAKVIRDAQTTHPKILKQLVDADVDLGEFAAYRNQGESVPDAARHSTVDKYAPEIAGQVGVPLDQTISVQAINGVLANQGYNPLPDDPPQRTIMDLTDEFMRLHIGMNSKGGQIAGIAAIIKEALTGTGPQASKFTPEALGKRSPAYVMASPILRQLGQGTPLTEEEQRRRLVRGGTPYR